MGPSILDGAVTIHTSQARTIGAAPLQVGSTVGVKGEVLGGVFAAKGDQRLGPRFRL